MLPDGLDMGNSTVQWRGAIGSYAAKICSNSWTRNSTKGASATKTTRVLKLLEMLVVRGIQEEAKNTFSWLNILFAIFIILGVVGVLVWGATLTKILVLINLPGAGKLLYDFSLKCEDFLSKHKLELWAVVTEIL